MIWNQAPLNTKQLARVSLIENPSYDDVIDFLGRSIIDTEAR